MRRVTMIDEERASGNSSILQDASSRTRIAGCNMIADEVKDDTDSRQEELTGDHEDCVAKDLVTGSCSCCCSETDSNPAPAVDDKRDVKEEPARENTQQHCEDSTHGRPPMVVADNAVANPRRGRAATTRELRDRLQRENRRFLDDMENIIDYCCENEPLITST
ncbi:uncharacterized protein LOC112589089 [Harpegnathos saltator]|uniref:uncharacterized protein LOC112589089 n=1 Tax=Harpegnathos saltator TaxID=610380 RepID=UPI000DBEF0B0|nr:uncharacterized protein LOC112589089 [Harpegnathos saltator]